MQNKPKVKIGKMNVTSFITMAYENKSNWTLGESGKNKAKQTQTKPNKAKVKIGKMNVTSFITMNYEQRTMNDEKNKAKQTQSPGNASSQVELVFWLDFGYLIYLCFDVIFFQCEAGSDFASSIDGAIRLSGDSYAG